MKNHSLLLCALLGMLLTFEGCESKIKWTYELISISSFSKDESKLKIETKIERSQYNDLSYTMIIDWLFDVQDGDMFETTVLRSSTGLENDFTPVPYEIPNMSFNDVIKEYYKDVIYPNVEDCSNLLPYKDVENRPWVKQKYTFERCVTNGKGFPEIMPEGTYKMNVVYTGTVEWGITFVVRLRSKLIP